MSPIALPVYAKHIPRATAVDRSKPYYSCDWLEAGIGFNRRSLHACLIVHHGRGFPFLCDFNGGAIPAEKVLAAREQIIAENQAGGHAACRGCRHLVKRRWPRRKYAFEVLGMAQFTHCNIECSYCFLQTQDPASFAAGFDPYPVLPAIGGLIEHKLLAPWALIDWGGGEPTIYREFDAVLELLTLRGAKHWIHTNGTRFPQALRAGLSGRRINVLCSVDAGSRETYKLIKRRDLYERVWENLESYVRCGCNVVAKYIVMEENCRTEELDEFVARASKSGIRRLVIDIDYNHPEASEEVMHGLRHLKRLAIQHRMNAAVGFTGAKFTPEVNVERRVSSGAPGSRLLRLQKQLLRVEVAVEEQALRHLRLVFRSLHQRGRAAGRYRRCHRRMKTFVVLILAAALIAAGVYTRPTRDDFKKAYIASATHDDANFIETAFNKWHANSFLGDCEFKDRLLWIDVERDGKTVFTGVFGHWFRRSQVPLKGSPLVLGW